LRPPIAAIYHFARTADDIADEGDAPAPQRLDELAVFRADLMALAANQPHSGRWPQVFEPLDAMLRQFQLPVQLLDDLLDAFAQDVRQTRDQAWYATQADLLDYCRRSAIPIGRLLLHLYGVTDADTRQHSDQICSALQLINFWQDLSVDIPRQRFYLPLDDCQAHGVSQADLLALQRTTSLTRLVAHQISLAKTMMRQGAALVHRLPGRAGWELRLVVQGGLRIVEKIEAMGFATLQERPKLTAWDMPLMLWRALWM
jgi:squalene synthase HpnC